MTNLSQPNNQDALLNAQHRYDAADMADQLKVMPTLEARLTTILNEINALRDEYDLDAGATVTVGKMPPYSSVQGGGVHIVTAFNGSGTDLLDVGFIGATTDPDAYATDLTLAAVGFIVLDDGKAVKSQCCVLLGSIN